MGTHSKSVARKLPVNKADKQEFKENIAKEISDGIGDKIKDVVRDEIQKGMKGVNAKHDDTNAKPGDTEARPSRVEEHPNDPGAPQDSGEPLGNRDDHPQDGAEGSGE